MFLVNSIIQCQSFGDVLGPCTCGFGAHLTPLCLAHLQHHLTSLSLFSLQLHREARAALTRASSSVQAAMVTVTGARTLLADLEGMCALLSPRLMNAQMPMTDTRAGLAAEDRSPVMWA